MAEPHPEVIDPRHPLVKRVRSICMRFPDAAEVTAWGRPTFRAGKKIFLIVSSTMDRPHTVVFKPSEETHRAYSQDDRFFPPKYWGKAGWLALDIGDETDWDEIAEIADESYRQVALVRQIRELDASTP